MSVVPIRKKTPLQFLETKAELSSLNFLISAALLLFMPVVLFCVVIEQIWPFWLIVLNCLVGIPIGFLMFKRSYANATNCISLTFTPTAPKRAKMTLLKAA
jgi:hypothetical protein